MYPVRTYFLDLNSVLIIYDSTNLNNLQIDYLNGIAETLQNILDDSDGIMVQWINIGQLEDENDFEEIILENVEIATQVHIH